MPPDDGSGGGGDVPKFGGQLAGSATLMVNEEGNYQSPRTPSDGGDEGGDSFVEIRNSFISQVHTGGQPSGGSRGDGGWGDGGGAEEAPQLHFSGRDIFALMGAGAHTPTEDWGDLNDPRALIAFTARLLHIGTTAAVARAVKAAVSM